MDSKLQNQGDVQTLDAYNKSTEYYARLWHESPPPKEIYDVVLRYFDKSKSIFDIGSGSGRDAAWLCARGYKVTGFDASKGMLEYSQKRYGHISFKFAQLPDLSEIESKSAEQILCATVIQHLDHLQIPSALQNLDRVLVSGGVLFLSWRRPPAGEVRARLEDNRLYTKIDYEDILRILKPENYKELFRETSVSIYSKNEIYTLVLKKLNQTG